MRLIVYPIQHLPKRIALGIQSEDGVQRACFDIRAWMEKYGHLDFAVWPTRPGESTPYQAADVVLANGVLIWTLNSTDTEIPGNGKLEIIAITTDKRKLSGACETSIAATSLPTDPEIPDINRPWVDRAVEAASTAQASAKSAAESADRAEASESAAEEHRKTAADIAQAVEKSETAAKDHADDAAGYAGRAKMFATLAEQSAATHGFFYTYIDDDGHLHYVRSDGMSDLNLRIEEGRLIASYGVA